MSCVFWNGLSIWIAYRFLNWLDVLDAGVEEPERRRIGRKMELAASIVDVMAGRFRDALTPHSVIPGLIHRATARAYMRRRLRRFITVRRGLA